MTIEEAGEAMMRLARAMRYASPEAVTTAIAPDCDDNLISLESNVMVSPDCIAQDTINYSPFVPAWWRDTATVASDDSPPPRFLDLLAEAFEPENVILGMCDLASKIIAGIRYMLFLEER